MKSPRDVHAEEQSKAALREIAGLVVHYTDCLEDSGFTRPEALERSDTLALLLLEVVFFDDES